MMELPSTDHPIEVDSVGLDKYQRMANSLFTTLSILVLAVVWSATFAQQAAIHAGTEHLTNDVQAPFYHGVASGDPTADAVIIWTRVSDVSEKTATVTWEISTDGDFNTTAQTGSVKTDATRDFTVKVDVKRLKPGLTYYYRFAHNGVYSSIGRTKTFSPSNTEFMQLAVVSCTSLQWGFFNGLGRIADRDEIDVVLHLGDYIYEYGTDGYGDTSIGRLHVPSHEIVSLDDYRTRYAQYRLDPDFQRAHQQHPFITIWDDHEITNNSYVSGAQNHQEDEGDYEERKRAARQAYYEWMPIRGKDNGKHYRNFKFGNLIGLYMLDERLEGRTQQLESLDDPQLQSSKHTMLGDEQLSWLLGHLANTRTRWQIIGNQVIFSDLDFTQVRPGYTVNFDAWDGYPVEKRAILRQLQKDTTKNVVFVTGDTHCSWAFEVPTSIMDYRTGEGSGVAIEIGTPSISSSNVDESVPVDQVLEVENAYINDGSNPHLKYVNLREHGYTILKISQDRMVTEWWYTPDVRTSNTQEHLGHSVMINHGQKEILSTTSR